jgi:hypothetical protein
MCRFVVNMVSAIVLICMAVSCTTSKYYIIDMHVDLKPSEALPYYEGFSYMMLIKRSALKDLNVDSQSVDGQRLLHNLYESGAVLIWKYRGGGETFGCCEYDDIDKGNAIYYDVLQRDSSTKTIEKYQNLEVPERNLEYLDHVSYTIDGKGIYIYHFKIWEANIEYCSCSRYTDTAAMPIYKEKYAFVKKMSNIQKPDTLQSSHNLRAILERLVNTDNLK